VFVIEGAASVIPKGNPGATLLAVLHMRRVTSVLALHWDAGPCRELQAITLN